MPLVNRKLPAGNPRQGLVWREKRSRGSRSPQSNKLFEVFADFGVQIQILLPLRCAAVAQPEVGRRLPVGAVPEFEFFGVFRNVGQIRPASDQSIFEILVAKANTIRAINGNTLVEKWHLDIGAAGSSIGDIIPADIDNDGFAEVIVAQNGIVSVLRVMGR